jgi:hypothetical protein
MSNATLKLMDLYHCSEDNIPTISRLKRNINILTAKRKSLIPNRESYLWHLKTKIEK